MIAFQNMYFEIGVPPVDTNGAAVSAASGYNTFDSLSTGSAPGYVSCLVAIGNIAANISAGTMKIEESDDDSSYSAITGLTFTDLTAAGSDNKLFAASWPMGGARKRYFRFSMTGGAGATLVCAIFVAERLNQNPTTAAGRGFTEHLVITA
jgi:hypothetical protein